MYKNKLNNTIKSETLEYIDQLNNLNEYSSWSQIQLDCAIRGIDLSSDIMSFFAFCAFYLKNMYELFLDCISNSNFLDENLKDINFISDIYTFSNCSITLSHSFYSNLRLFIYNHCFVNDSVEFIQNQVLRSESYYDSSKKRNINTHELRKYLIFNQIFKKCPIQTIKLFDIKKSYILKHDIYFLSWLIQKIKTLSQKNSSLIPILNVLEKYYNQQQKLNSFLN